MKSFHMIGLLTVCIGILPFGGLVSAQAPNVAKTQSDGTLWIQTWIDANLPSVVEDYWWLHENPELSYQEVETAKYVAAAWKKAGYEVTTDLGGHGVVAVLANGAGPTLMLRTDLDALPVSEVTGLPRASTKKTTLASGASAGIMHACGHDVHMSNLIAVGRLMSANKDRWRGTLMLVGQPAEERGGGAMKMIEDGLFTKFKKPDFALALHCESTKATTVALRDGYMMANVDSVDIVVKGRGGHGAAPNTTIDPIVQAAELVMSIQTIVSREVKPTEPAVITVGAIHGGTKHNIIGDRCDLQLTVRSYTPEVRKLLLDSIHRKAKAIAAAYGAEEPIITLSDGTPALFNNIELTNRLRKTLEAAIGKERVGEADQVMGGEDFSQYGIAGVPCVMYRVGTIEAGRFDAMQRRGQTISLHAPEYYPDIDKTLPTAILTMAAGAVEILR
jgi:amidohydrolase